MSKAPGQKSQIVNILVTACFMSKKNYLQVRYMSVPSDPVYQSSSSLGSKLSLLYRCKLRISMCDGPTLP